MRNQRQILGIKWNESVSNEAVIPTTEREDIRMTVAYKEGTFIYSVTSRLRLSVAASVAPAVLCTAFHRTHNTYMYVLAGYARSALTPSSPIRNTDAEAYMIR